MIPAPAVVGKNIRNVAGGSDLDCRLIDLILIRMLFYSVMSYLYSLFAAGTVAKLIKEGYTGYLIRTTNDDHAGRGETLGDVIKNNSADNDAVAETLGLKKVFNLNYRNHRLDEERFHYIGPQESKLATYIDENVRSR